MSRRHELQGLDSWLDRCPYCGETGCYGYCLGEPGEVNDYQDEGGEA